MRHEVVSSQDGAVMDAFALSKPPGWGTRFAPRAAGPGALLARGGMRGAPTTLA